MCFFNHVGDGTFSHLGFKISIFIVLLLLWHCRCHLGFVISSLFIDQSPRHLVLPPDRAEVVFDCVPEGKNYPYRLWYQRRTEGRMVLVGVIYHSHAQVESDFMARFRITGNNEMNTDLTISNVSLADSAQYFCAARMHSVSF